MKTYNSLRKLLFILVLSLSAIALLFAFNDASTNRKERSSMNEAIELKNYSRVIIKNGQYGYNSKFQTYDFYSSENEPAANKPLVILIHSGAFISGDKRDREIVELSETIASNGFNVASINYQLIEVNGTFLNRLPFAACRELVYESFQDLSLAVRYFRSNSETYNIANDKIFLVGYSAGAISALNTTFLNQADMTSYFKNDELECMHCKGNVTSDFRVSGIVSISGAMFDLLALNNLDDSVPTLFIHGEEDGIVNLNMSKPFEKYVQKDLELNIPGISHQLNISQYNSKIMLNYDPKLVLHKQYLKFFRNSLFPNLYGPGLLQKRMKINNMESRLIKVKGGKHNLFYDLDGTETSYMTSLKKDIVEFLNTKR